MSYEFNSYWYVVLACATVSIFVVSQYLVSLLWKAYKLHAGSKRALKRVKNLKQGEPLERQTAASSDPPAQANVEAAPIFEDREAFESEPAASLELPAQTDIEIAPIFEDLKAFESQPQASLERPALTGAAVESIREHPESRDVEPPATPELTSQAKAEVSPLEPQLAARPKLAIPHGRKSLESRQAPRLTSRVSTGSQPIRENPEASESEVHLNRDPLSQAPAEVPLVIERAEALEAQQAASLEQAAQVSGVLPIVEDAELPEFQPAVRSESPAQAGAEVARILENRDLLKSQSIVSLESPAHTSAEAAQILVHREGFEPEAPLNRDVLSEASAEVPLVIEPEETLQAQQAASVEQLAQVSAVLSVLEDAELPELQPAVRLESPAQAGAEIAPILKNQEVLKSQTTASLEPPAQTVTAPILEHREVLDPEASANRNQLSMASAEVPLVIEHAQALEARQAAGLQPPAQVSAVQRILEDAELPELQPAVRPEPPAQADAGYTPTREQLESLEAQKAASLEPSLAEAALPPILEHREPLAQAGAEVPSILKHRELFNFQAVRANGYTAQNDYEHSVPEDNKAIKPAPKIEKKPSDKVNADADLKPEAIQASVSEYHDELGQIAAALDQLAMTNGSKAGAPIRKEDTSEDKSATNEECADKGGLNVSLRQVTEGSTQTGDEANAEADLAAPEATQALNSGNNVKLGQLGSAKGKVEGASTPMGVSTSQVRSAANGVAKGWLGMSLRQVTEGAAQTLNVRPDYGAFVANLNENSPAISAGIERGDIIINFDGKDIKDWRELPRSVADTPAGKEVMVTIIRKGKELTKVVKVGRPEDSDNRTSFTSMEASAPKEKQMRKNARGFDPAGSATLGRMTFGRRRATAASQ